jgi:hypothetical protein
MLKTPLQAAVAICSLIYALHAGSEDCSEKPMTADARDRALRVAGAYRLVQSAPSDVDAHITAAQVIYDVLADNSTASDEALAALTGYSVSDSDEIKCEILKRGKPLLPDLIQFEKCPPVLPLDASRANARAEFVRLVEQGKLCD